MGDLHIRHSSGGRGDEVAALALGAAMAAALIHLAWHAISVVLEVIAWVAAGTAGTVAVAGGVMAGLRVRRAVRASRARRAAALARPVVTITPRDHARPAAVQAARPAIAPPRPVGSWPLPGWWEEIRPRIGGDSDEYRPR